MTSQSSMRKSSVAAVLIAVMVVSVTGLFGAPGATVKITSPRSGAKVSGDIEVAASIKTSAAVSYAILVADQERPCVTNSSPYRFELDTRAMSNGAHRLFVEVYDSFGLVASSKAITIYVKNGSSPPAAQKAAAATRTAAKPSSVPPATSVVAGQGPGKPQVVAEAADQQAATSAASTMVGRGPLPEPSSVAATPVEDAKRATAPAVSSYASANAGVVSDRPPAPAGASAPAPRPSAHTIMLDGKVVCFDVDTRIVEGRLQAGFRALFTENGGRVAWVSSTRTARSVSPTLIVEVPVGSATATVNGRSVDMGAVATVRDGRTIIPVRFFAEAAGVAVNWDGGTRIASLSSRAPTRRAQAE